MLRIDWIAFGEWASTRAFPSDTQAAQAVYVFRCQSRESERVCEKRVTRIVSHERGSWKNDGTEIPSMWGKRKAMHTTHTERYIHLTKSFCIVIRHEMKSFFHFCPSYSCDPYQLNRLLSFLCAVRIHQRMLIRSVHKQRELYISFTFTALEDKVMSQ